MPVVEIHKDTKALTMKVVAQFAAPVAKVWAAYADARKLERFWGPRNGQRRSPATTSRPAAAPSTT
jgi:uncharacterized protein YndB with AHSA1/START domain